MNKIAEKRLENSLPNAVVAYRILITISVSVATGERTFSKLKIVKNYLRNRLLQDRLSDLAIISIENNASKSLDYSKICDEFARSKAKKRN